MRFLISEELVKYTNFQSEIEIRADVMHEAIGSLFSCYPQFYAFLVFDEGREANKTSLQLNGTYLVDASALWIPLKEDDVLVFGRDIPEGENGVVKIIAGAVLFVAGAISENPQLMAFGLSVAMGGVAEMIMGKPNLPMDGNSSSATYTFSGIKNTTTSGTPISLVYGRHRVGGHVLSCYVDVPSNSQDSFLYVLIGLSEGEIGCRLSADSSTASGIDPNSLQLNNIAVSSLADVTVYWRAGDADGRIGMNDPLRLPIDNLSSSASNLTPANMIEAPAPDPYWDTYYYQDIQNVIDATSLSIKISVAFGHWALDLLDAEHDVKLVDTRYINVDKVTSGNDAIDSAANMIGETHFNTFNFTRFTGTLRIRLTTHGKHRTRMFSYTLYYGDTGSQDNNPVMHGFTKISNTNTYNSKIINTNPDLSEEANAEIGAFVFTQTPVDEVQFLVSAPAFYTENGLKLAQVDFNLYCRKSHDDHPADGGWHLVEDRVAKTTYQTIKGGPSKTEFIKRFSIDFTAEGFATPDYFDVKLVRITPNHAADMKVIDDIWLKDFTEVANESFLYPWTALIGYRIKATDEISGGMPTITQIVNGIKVAVPVGYESYYDIATDRPIRRQVSPWTGALTYDEATASGEKTWTDSPVWVLLDLLISRRYGLGDDFRVIPDKFGLMLANFYSMAQICDQYIYSDGSLAAFPVDPAEFKMIDGVKEYPRPRFSINLVIDESKSAREWVNVICASMRATLFQCEGLAFLDIDRVKPITQIFNMSNITEFTQAGGSFSSIPNCFEVQFPNRDKEYATDSFVMETLEYQQNQTLNEQKTNLQLIGVTNERDARRLTSYALALSQSALTTVTFKTGTNALMATVTDVIGIQHDVNQTGSGGRIVALTPTVNNTYTVTLSTPFTYTATDTDPNDGSLWGDLGLSSSVSPGQSPFSVPCVNPTQSGTYTEVVVITQARFGIGSPYVLNFVTNVVKPFKIVSLKRDTDEFVTVSAVEYNAAIYNDDTGGFGWITPVNYSQLPVTLKQSVRNFRVEAKIYVDTAGVVKTGVDAWYSLPTNSLLWAGVYIAWKRNDSDTYTYTPLDSSGHVFIPEIGAAGDYTFVAVSLFTDGTKQSILQCLNDNVYLPFAFIYLSPFIPNEYFLGGVSGLEVIGSPDGSYYGKECKLRWRAPVAVDQYLSVDASGAASGNTTSSWLAYYLIEIRNTDGTLRRTAKQSAEEYSYNHEMNHQDGYPPARTYDVTVIAVDRLGRESKPVTLRVTNPPPAVIRAV